jgi:hypothetical protein
LKTLSDSGFAGRLLDDERLGEPGDSQGDQSALMHVIGCDDWVSLPHAARGLKVKSHAKKVLSGDYRLPPDELLGEQEIARATKVR